MVIYDTAIDFLDRHSNHCKRLPTKRSFGKKRERESIGEEEEEEEGLEVEARGKLFWKSSRRSTWNSYKVVKEAEPGKYSRSPRALTRGGMAGSGVLGILITIGRACPRVLARTLEDRPPFGSNE